MIYTLNKFTDSNIVSQIDVGFDNYRQEIIHVYLYENDIMKIDPFEVGEIIISEMKLRYSNTISKLNVYSEYMINIINDDVICSLYNQGYYKYEIMVLYTIN